MNEDKEIARLRQQMLTVARRYLGDSGEAEDAVHDAMLSLWQRKSTNDAPPHPQHNSTATVLPQHNSSPADGLVPMAIVAVRNRALNILRSRRTTLTPNERTPDTSPTPEQQIVADESRRLTDCIISQLPPMQQLVMRMCHDDGLTNSEIAHLTGLTNDAVRQHLSRARRKIFNELSKHAQQ